VFKTSDGADAFKVTLSNGKIIYCTINHKWLIGENGNRVHTIDLKPGDKITNFELPVIDVPDTQIFSNAREHGFLSGGLVDIDNKFPSPKFNCRYQHYTPINYSLNTKVEWLHGFLKNIKWCDIDKIFKIKNNSIIFLNDVQLLMDTMNIKCIVKDYHILITKSEIEKIQNTFNIIIEPSLHQYQNAKDNEPITIVDVCNTGKSLPMYCFEEPLKSTGTFNGIVTGQSEVYSLLIDTYIKDSNEKAHLLNAINTIPTIAEKAEWAIKWITDKKASFPTRLLAFACVEGIFFSGAFCSIFWLKERGIMPGLTLSNEFISRDESLHTEFAVLLYSQLPKEERLNSEEAYEMIREAIEIEERFINHSIPCNLLGMNANLMSQYIQFVADRLLIQLGYDPLFNVSNPFHFMDRISLTNKTNFFEHTRQSEYSRARVGNNQKDNEFGLDADF